MEKKDLITVLFVMSFALVVLTSIAIADSASSSGDVSAMGPYPYITSATYDCESTTDCSGYGGTANVVTLTESYGEGVVCNATFKDDNGYQDIIQADGQLFDDSMIGSPLESDMTDHNDFYYTSNCNLINASGSSLDDVLVSCQFNVSYYANNDTWYCRINVTDYAGLTNQSNATFTMSDLVALSLPNSTLTFTEKDPGTTYQNNNISLLINNTGNVYIDAKINSTDFNEGNSSFVATIDNENLYFNASRTIPTGTSLSDETIGNNRFNIDIVYRMNDTTSCRVDIMTTDPVDVVQGNDSCSENKTKFGLTIPSGSAQFIPKESYSAYLNIVAIGESAGTLGP